MNNIQKNHIINPYIGIYFRFLRCEKKLSLHQLSKLTFIDVSTLSKFENNKTTLTVQNYKHLLSFHELEETDLIPFDYKIKNKLDLLIYLTLYRIRDSSTIFEIEHYNLNQIDYPYRILFNFFLCSYYKIYDFTFINYVNQLLPNINCFEDRYKKFFYTEIGYHYSYMNNYDLSIQYLKKALEIPGYEEIDGVTYMHLVPAASTTKTYLLSMTSYERAHAIFKKYQMNNRLFSLYGNLAVLYSTIGDRESAIQMHAKGLEVLDKNDKRQRFILHANIAYQYFVLEQYNNAIQYYLEAFQYDIDNGCCFEIAWCYYKLNKKTEALAYIEKAKTIKEYAPLYQIYVLYTDWLYAMYQKKYSNKCLALLKKIEKNYAHTVSKTSYCFLCDRLIEHYVFLKDYENTFHYSQKKNLKQS